MTHSNFNSSQVDSLYIPEYVRDIKSFTWHFRMKIMFLIFYVFMWLANIYARE